MYKKTQNCQNATSSQIDLHIQHNNNKNLSVSFSAYPQTDFKVCVERLKTQNSQHNPEEKK